MRLSFVIPAYNEESYIGKCLDSIMKYAGNNSDIEVIVVNNGSTDSTREIAASYPGVKIIDEPERGTSSARQAGLMAAQSDLVANIDADNILTPEWIRTALKEFSNHPELVCLSGPFHYYDLPKRIKMLVKIFYFISFFVYILNHFVLRRASIVQGGNFVVRKSAILKIGGYNKNLTFYGDDADIALRLSKIGKIKFTFRLPIYASGRRLAKEGAFTTGLKYGINYFWIVLFKRPFTKTATIVRGTGESHYAPVRRIRDLVIAAITGIVLLAILLGGGWAAYRIIKIIL